MRHFFFVILLFICSLLSAQSWQSGTLKLYTNPDSTKVGIGISSPTELLHINKGALKIGNSTSASDRSKNLLKFGDGSYVQIGEWEADDELSFKAIKYNFTNGKVGIKVANPQYDIDLNGSLYLHTVNIDNSITWQHSYLYWEAHSLVMGTPEGKYKHNSVDLMPGGATQAPLFSQLRMYTADSIGVQNEIIRFNTMYNCWINTPGKIGIGTDSPQYKLDVNGTIRAKEILVQSTGADFVFDDDYKLLTLHDLKQYVKQNHHLPEIQSAEQMQQEGVSLDKLAIQLLQKLEEQTLYIIQLEERISELEKNK